MNTNSPAAYEDAVVTLLAAAKVGRTQSDEGDPSAPLITAGWTPADPPDVITVTGYDIQAGPDPIEPTWGAVQVLVRSKHRRTRNTVMDTVRAALQVEHVQAGPLTVQRIYETSYADLARDTNSDNWRATINVRVFA